MNCMNLNNFMLKQVTHVDVLAHLKLDGGKLVQNEMNLDMKEDQSCFLFLQIYLSFHHNYHCN